MIAVWYTLLLIVSNIFHIDYVSVVSLSSGKLKIIPENFTYNYLIQFVFLIAITHFICLQRQFNT